MLRLITMAIAIALLPFSARAADYFTVTFVDDTSGTPLQGVQVRVNERVFTTDSAGRIRYYEADLTNGSLATFFDLGHCQTLGSPPYKCAYGLYLSATTCSVDSDCVTSTGGTKWNAPAGPFSRGVTFRARGGYEGLVGLCPVGSGSCLPGQAPDAATLPSSTLSAPIPATYEIRVEDAATNRGIPNMAVAFTGGLLYTDSAGRVAYQGAMGSPVTFTTVGFGYGIGGATLTPTANGSATISVSRTNLAERLYRVTGEGIYWATRLLGLTDAPIAAPMLNRAVFGQDTAQTAVYNGKVYWFWGDTHLADGNRIHFATGATSELPANGGLDPMSGVDLSYFVDGNGLPKPMCPNTSNGVPWTSGTPGMCWLFGAVTMPDATSERLYVRYLLVGGNDEGIARFDDTLGHFQRLVSWPSTQKVRLRGHPLKRKHGSTTWAYYPDRDFVVVSNTWLNKQQTTRVIATETDLADYADYEAFTPLQTGSNTLLDVNVDGTLNYQWRTGTRTLGDDITTTPSAAAGQKLYGHEQDPDAGTASLGPAGLLIANVSTDWNPYRTRFAQVAQTGLGSENWYFEGDTPMGPWVYGRRIVQHAFFGDTYTLYQMRHHPFFDQNGGRDIFFEGTYTTFPDGSRTPTPRENYNQVMYHLDLDDVVLPVPVYDLTAATVPGGFVTKRGIRTTTPTTIAAFMAPDRAGYANTVPLWWNDAACRPNRQLIAGGTPTTEPVFWALPASTTSPPPTTTALYEYSNGSQRAYTIASSLTGYTQVGVVAYVWVNPMRVPLPTQDYLAALVADGGADKCQTEYNPSSGAYVSLSAAASTHSGGTIASYAWSWAGGGSASGSSPMPLFPVGLTEVTLTTTGSDGATSTDKVLVRVDGCASGCCDPTCC